jgi:ABC-type uncharacterized transport system auxiliary subunit
MRSRFTLVALTLTVVLAMLLLMLSCGTGPQNTTQIQNQNQTQVSEASLDSNDPCKQTTPTAKKAKLKEKVIGKIDNDSILRKQYYGYGEYPPGHQNDPPRFSSRRLRTVRTDRRNSFQG